MLTLFRFLCRQSVTVAIRVLCASHLTPQATRRTGRNDCSRDRRVRMQRMVSALTVTVQHSA